MTQDSLSDRCYLCTDTHELHRILHPDFQFKNKNRLPPFSLFDLYFFVDGAGLHSVQRR